MLIQIRRDEFVNHEAEMFAYNKLNGFVPFTIVHKSLVHEVTYAMEGLVSLKRFVLGEGKLRFELFSLLLESIASCYKTCEEYLLVFEHISFSLEDVYMMEDGYGFMFVPSNRPKHSCEVMRAFVEGLTEVLDTKDKKVVEKLHQIQLAFKKEPFVIERFIQSMSGGCRI